MPAKIKCEFCGEIIADKEGLFNHQAKEHRLMYLPITEEWLKQLVEFMFTGDSEILDKNFVVYLQKMLKNVALNNMRKGKE